MSRVTCSVEQTLLFNEDGQNIDGVRAICSRCEHETESFGTEDTSIRRCLALMRDECPNKENNYYIEEFISYPEELPKNSNLAQDYVKYSLADDAWEVLYIHGDYTVGSGVTFNQCMTYWSAILDNSGQFFKEVQRVGKVVFGDDEYGCIITHCQHEGNESVNGDLYT